MKTMKKPLIAVFCICLIFTILSCSGGQKTDKNDGVNAWVFKSSGIIFGDLLYQGFKEVMDSKGENSIYQAPAEPTVTAQVQILDELITQGVKSISISTNGDQGYDRIMQKAKDMGIPLFSADSALSPDLRVTHINPTSQTGIGTALIQAAVLINLRIPYPADRDLAKAANEALASYNGPEMKFGVLSASIDTPVQNGWIVKMHEELQKDIYKGKVNPQLDVKYGNDVLTESTIQANAFISEDKVSVIISPTTIGMAAAGQALSAAPNSKIKLTGLGLPSEMQSFMPLSPNDDEFSKVCPYMMLWDVIDMGRVLAGAAYAATQGTFDGKPGSTFQLDAYSSYPARTYKAENDPDGKPGTVVIVGDPYVFSKDNMADWINVL